MRRIRIGEEKKNFTSDATIQKRRLDKLLIKNAEYRKRLYDWVISGRTGLRPVKRGNY